MGYIRGTKFHDDSYIDNDRSRGLRFRYQTAEETDASLEESRATAAEDGARERRQAEFDRVLRESAQKKAADDERVRKSAASRVPAPIAWIDWDSVKR